MKIKTALCVAAVFLSLNIHARGQGTVTFNEPWIFTGINSTQNYNERGMWFRVVTSPPSAPYHFMTRIGSLATVSGAHNGTPTMAWSNDSGRSDSVIFSVTDGSAFGLTSVDLGNFGSSLQPSIAITFNGFRTDGSMVTATFNTPNNNLSTFTTYNFGAAFGSGLTRVEIPSQFWAMDNLVVIPEPGTFALLGLGLLAVAARRFNQQRKR